MSSPVNADFTQIRYAQCWEDADLLVKGLRPQAGQRILSICSAGDNALALLASGATVVAVDLNPAQLHCLALRVAAYRNLDHSELLELIGSRPSHQRAQLYTRCRSDLRQETRTFWDAHPTVIQHGIGGAGKFERYFALFRNRLLPMVHQRRTIDRLLEGGSPDTQTAFYENTWNNWRWRALFALFFSRTVMGYLGRSPAFFAHVEGSVADRILDRSRYALTQIDCATNPYLQWILTGTHGRALPYALRPENFDAIRRNLDNLSWHLSSLEAHFDSQPEPFDAFNLSDIFEYVNADHTARLLARIADHANPEARLAYWNMLVPRSRPSSLAHRLRPLDAEATALFAEDKAFFYSRFVLEQKIAL